MTTAIALSFPPGFRPHVCARRLATNHEKYGVARLLAMLADGPQSPEALAVRDNWRVLSADDWRWLVMAAANCLTRTEAPDPFAAAVPFPGLVWSAQAEWFLLPQPGPGVCPTGKAEFETYQQAIDHLGHLVDTGAGEPSALELDGVVVHGSVDMQHRLGFKRTVFPHFGNSRRF